MTADETSKIALGSVLVDKYRITREIGRGGMAAVYEAENVDIGKRVAVKVLSAELVTSRVVRERFLREARAASAVRSPYICDVYDVNEFDNRPFLVMELLEGESLYDRMTRVRRLDIPTTLKIVTQTAKGLAKAHAAGVVHRDLKPENLFLTRSEEGELITKLLDFGLAKFYSPTDASDQVRLTREGALFGTPAYMSPEQAKGRGEVDHRSDLWALACIVYECLTGHTVWNVEQGVAMILAQVASAPLPVPSKLRPDLPPAFDQWFVHALQRAPENRFQTAAQFTIALTDALAPEDSGHVKTPSLLVDVDEVLQRVATEGPSTPDVHTSVPSDFLHGTKPSPPPRVSPQPAVNAQTAATGTSPTASKPAAASRFGKRGILAAGAVLLVAAAIGGGLFAYRARWPLTLMADARPSDSADALAGTPAESGGYADTVVKAQTALLVGNSDEALRLLEDAIKNGGEGIATNLRTHIRAALETPHAPCQLRAIGRPRPFGRSAEPTRPTILSARSASMVTWGDGHENKARRQLYSVLLDRAMRRTSDAQPLSPEVQNARYPQLMQLGTQRALLFWDGSSKEGGIFARYVDDLGRIQGDLKPLARVTKSDYDPTYAVDQDNSIWVSWDDDGTDGSQHLMLRHFDPRFNPLGPAVVLATLHAVERGPKVSILRPAIAASYGKLRVLFTIQQGTARRVHSLLLGTDSSEIKNGLQPTSAVPPPEQRSVVPIQPLGKDGAISDEARITCLKDTCYSLWYEQAAGIVANAVDAKTGEQVWRYEIGSRGRDPAIALGSDQLMVAWYEQQSRVRVALVDRQGVSTVSTVGKVSGIQPLPDVAKGRDPNQWLLAWRDFEAGHLEIISASIECRKEAPARP